MAVLQNHPMKFICQVSRTARTKEAAKGRVSCPLKAEEMIHQSIAILVEFLFSFQKQFNKTQTKSTLKHVCCFFVQFCFPCSTFFFLFFLVEKLQELVQKQHQQPASVTSNSRARSQCTANEPFDWTIWYWKNNCNSCWWLVYLIKTFSWLMIS